MTDDDIGKILKSKRQKDNLTLSKISEDLKIQLHYLEAIENDLASSINAYMIGYAKLYANYLNLDINEQIEVLKKTSKIALYTDSNIKINVDAEDKGFPFIYSIVAIFVFVFSFAAIYWINNSSVEFNKMRQSWTETIQPESNAKLEEQQFYVRKLNANEYLVKSGKNQFYIIAEDPTEVAILNDKGEIIESYSLSLGERKLLVIDDLSELKIKTESPNSLTIQQEN